jgi:predicted DNA-binding transcriptional regulator YafY
VLALLREAVAARTAVRIGYSDEAGEPRIHSVEPIRVTAGKVTAYDHGDDTVRTFVIARITGVAPR